MQEPKFVTYYVKPFLICPGNSINGIEMMVDVVCAEIRGTVSGNTRREASSPTESSPGSMNKEAS